MFALGRVMHSENSHPDVTSDTYSDGEVRSLEMIWGAGYLSPGGAEAVARIVGDVPIAQKAGLI